jgi:hypothetical protein
MITRTEIDLEKDLNTDKLVKKNIDAGQEIFVLDSEGPEKMTRGEVNVRQSKFLNET